jgi:hypothetical protein
MFKLLLIFLIFVNLALIIGCLPLPFDEYSYLLARNKVKQLDINETYLSSIEKSVSIYFEKIKSDEFRKTSSFFYPSRPIEDVLDLIQGSSVYDLLKKVPKGNF